jgi:hypothetical protein
MRAHPRAQLGLIVTAVAVVWTLAGCGAASSPSELESVEALSLESGPAPTFDGPWAAEFAEYSAGAPNDFVRTALADGEISDAEYAEMTERFRSCLADAGITFHGFQPDGAFSTSLAPDGLDTHEAVNGCAGPSGQDSIGLLHDIMLGNPDNIDAATAIAACLVESGEVPTSYTADDYRMDRDGRFGDTETLDTHLAEVLGACMTDPFDIAQSR